jgi:23S rRNA pseudouridine2605 synthase
MGLLNAAVNCVLIEAMTDSELLQARTQKWRLDGQAVRTLDDARAFLESVGFCLMYPTRPPLLVPTFIGAWVGADDKLPARQHAYNDPRAKDATELMVRCLRDKAAYEAPLMDENNAFLLAPSVFPYFYSLVGERNPKQAPVTGPRSSYSPLACDAFEIIRRRGPISKSKLGEMLGGSVSNAGLDRALSELWAKLRITRVDYTVEEGSVWDELSRWAPDIVREGVGLSLPEALSALVSKYLDCVVAVDEVEVENFLINFVPRTRVKEAIHALLSARELSFVHVGSKSLLQVTPPKVIYVPKNRRPERVI